MLVPAESLGGIFPPAKTAQTPGTPESRLDTQMREILDREFPDQREKWHEYAQILDRFLNLRKKKEKIPSSKKK